MNPFWLSKDSLSRKTIFIAGFLFVYTGLAYDAFGTPRPDSYFQSSESKAPVVTQRYEAKSQLDLRTK